jgi:hypothetical protein
MRTIHLALCLTISSACFPSPPPEPPPAEVRLWHGDCKDHTAELTQPVGLNMGPFIGMPNADAKVARYQRLECGGSWAVALLMPTGRFESGYWVYSGTDLAPPFAVP